MDLKIKISSQEYQYVDQALDAIWNKNPVELTSGDLTLAAGILMKIKAKYENERDFAQMEVN